MISQADYDQFLQMRATQSTVIASHATTSGTNALLASRNSDWIIDSGASSHMTGTQNLFTRLSQLLDISSVFIADGRTCLVAGEGVVHVSSHTTLEKVLFVSDFPVNLLSISAITKQLYCFVTFYPLHYTFQDLQMGKRIGLGCERGNGVYLLVRDNISKRLVTVASMTDSSFLWHYRLRHPSHCRLQ